MSTCRVAFSYDTLQEMEQKIIRFMNKRGFTVERRTEQVTVKALAARVKRPVGSVSRSLHRLSAPPYDATWGRGLVRKRILLITPNARLLDWLTL